MRNIALQRIEFVFFKKICHGRVIGRGHQHLIIGHGQRNVRFDGHELARQGDMAPGLLELGLLAGRKLGQMFIDSVHRAVFGDEFRRANLPHALDAGDVVGRVAAEGQHIDHLRRRGDAPVLRELGRADDFPLSPALSGLVLQHVRGNQLAVILVRGHHIDGESVGGGAHGHGTDDVVGLETAFHQHRHPKGLQQLRQRLQRIDDQLGRRRTRALVGRVHLIAERAAGRVEGHGKMRRLFAVDELQQIFRETEEDGSVHPLRVDHRPAEERVVHLEDERVSVNEIEGIQILLAEIAFVKTEETGTVAGFVLGHFVDGVVDGVIAQLLGLGGDGEFTFAGACLGLIALLEVGLGVPNHLTEQFGETCAVVCLFKGITSESLSNLRITFAVGLTAHCQIHADLGSLCHILGVKVFEHLITGAFGDADDMFGHKVKSGALVEDLPFNYLFTLWASFRSFFSFINEAANWTYEFFLHDNLFLV